MKYFAVLQVNETVTIIIQSLNQFGITLRTRQSSLFPYLGSEIDDKHQNIKKHKAHVTFSSLRNIMNIFMPLWL